MCIESWKKHAPDFEILNGMKIIVILMKIKYVEKAYEDKKWAFVSDYFRLKVLYEMGGVYLDTDMELMKPLEPCLYQNAFFAFYFLQTPEKACMKVLTKQKQQTEQYLLQILSQEFCGFLYMFFHRTG